MRLPSLLAGSNERCGALLPWQNLNFLPLPHGQGAYGPRRLSSIAVIAITSDGGRPSRRSLAIVCIAWREWVKNNSSPGQR
jgi:hypothetical protein